MLMPDTNITFSFVVMIVWPGPFDFSSFGHFSVLTKNNLSRNRVYVTTLYSRNRLLFDGNKAVTLQSR